MSTASYCICTILNLGRKITIKSPIFIFFKIWKNRKHLWNVGQSAVKFRMNPTHHLWVLPPNIFVLSWIWAGNFKKNGHKIANFQFFQNLKRRAPPEECVLSSCKISKESVKPSLRYDVERTDGRTDARTDGLEFWGMWGYINVGLQIVGLWKSGAFKKFVDKMGNLWLVSNTIKNNFYFSFYMKYL